MSIRSIPRTTPLLAILLLLVFGLACQKDADTADAEGTPETDGGGTIAQTPDAEGWMVLFDGTSTEHWRGYRTDSLPEAWGVLRVTIFDNKLEPVAERLIQRETDRKVAITITPERKKLAPGEKQKIKIRTTDETGEPVVMMDGALITEMRTAAVTAAYIDAVAAPAVHNIGIAV